MRKIKVMIDDGAYMPERAHTTDAGYDLRSPDDAYLAAFTNVTIDTGVHMLIPEGYAGVLVSKSGLNIKDDITSTGLIDSGYTDSIRVKLYNHGANGKSIKRGMKISQIIIVPVMTPELEETDELPETERGDNGFGSSGA